MRMKKKIFFTVIVVNSLLAILFFPIPTGTLNDGGTRVYSALTYKIVVWNRTTDDGIYENTKVYFGEARFQDINGLWDEESQNVRQIFRGKITKIDGYWVTVEPLDGEMERHSSLEISFHTSELPNIDVQIGDVVEITYRGNVTEIGNAKIFAEDWNYIQ